MQVSPSSHFDHQGNARMVDVSAKEVTARRAVACGEITMQAATAVAIRQGQAKKGDVLAVARLAAIQASKLTQQLIPLCHAIAIESVHVDFAWPEADPQDSHATLRCRVTVGTTAKTGVEMEAMTAVSIACLTVYDMVKSMDREVTIGAIGLQEKSGGKSGHFLRKD
ncbi:MAG: cyclic pyranopterin monophosphate synthase MoaC [Pirellulales bacterium]|nr:cyclic pyranopterin monophosphate synthase MoaC [Pirellulales bacterium]